MLSQFLKGWDPRAAGAVIMSCQMENREAVKDTTHGRCYSLLPEVGNNCDRARLSHIWNVWDRHEEQREEEERERGRRKVKRQSSVKPQEECEAYPLTGRTREESHVSTGTFGQSCWWEWRQTSNRWPSQCADTWEDRLNLCVCLSWGKIALL